MLVLTVNVFVFDELQHGESVSSVLSSASSAVGSSLGTFTSFKPASRRPRLRFHVNCRLQTPSPCPGTSASWGRCACA